MRFLKGNSAIIIKFKSTFTASMIILINISSITQNKKAKQTDKLMTSVDADPVTDLVPENEIENIVYDPIVDTKPDDDNDDSDDQLESQTTTTTTTIVESSEPKKTTENYIP